MKRRIVCAALCLASILVTMSPHVARADSGVLFGNLPWPSGSSYTAPASDTVFLDINPMYNITKSGILTRWDWYAQSSLCSGASDSMYLMVWRPTINNSSIYTLEYQQWVPNKTDGAQWVDAEGNFLVKQGDVLGFYLSAGSQHGIAEAYNLGSSSSVSWTTSGPLSVGATHSIGEGEVTKSSKTYALAAEISPVPEPSTVVAALSVLAPVGLFFRRKRKPVL
ncbi:MAG: PEP-CTERM sorting domain-containing protein [Armatimonadota bacterium]